MDVLRFADTIIGSAMYYFESGGMQELPGLEAFRNLNVKICFEKRFGDRGSVA